MESALSVDDVDVKISRREQQLEFAGLHLSPSTSNRIVPLSVERGPSVLELCAGAGGQALGFENAGFVHAGLVELDKHACLTLRQNRPDWNVIEADLREFDAADFEGVDLIAGGLPCPPFSVAGKQLGRRDERNLFPELIRLVDQVKPKAIMVENVRGLLEARFDEYRNEICTKLAALGFASEWRLLNASDYGVVQVRQRAVLAAFRHHYLPGFKWPEKSSINLSNVGEVLFDLMSENGWKQAGEWRRRAGLHAPTIVGGSHKHGGPDLGPTRARAAWSQLGVDGIGIANQAPAHDFSGTPRLTLRMVARLQGFPDNWHFAGGKTAAYRQIGNAMPPPMAHAIAFTIKAALSAPSFTVLHDSTDAEFRV